MTQQTVVTPTRRSPRRGRMPEKKVEESSTTTTTVTKDSSSVTTTRVTRSVTKKLIAEEKEALLTAEIKPTMSKRRHGYEFGGPFGVFCMMIALPAIVVASYLFCRGGEPCSIRRLPSIPPLWRFKGGFFDIGHLIVDGWIILQALFYMLPVGKVCICMNNVPFIRFPLGLIYWLTIGICWGRQKTEALQTQTDLLLCRKILFQHHETKAGNLFMFAGYLVPG